MSLEKERNGQSKFSSQDVDKDIEIYITDETSRQNDPYFIKNADDLRAIEKNLGGHYILASDINLMNEPWQPLKNFSGKLDGAGFCICNLKVSGQNNLGLFEDITTTAIVENICLNVNVRGKNLVAGLVAKSSGVIRNCKVTGMVRGGQFVGGLVARQYAGAKIENSSADVEIVSNYVSSGYAGGLIGHSVGTIVNSSATGNVSGRNAIGGLVGYQATGKIRSCFATGDVCGNHSIGGLVGKAESATLSKIEKSFATGKICSKGSNAGGLIGFSNFEVIDCYASGNVKGTHFVGGLIGKASGEHSALIQDNYARGNVVATGWYIGGLIGYSNCEVDFCYSTGRVFGNFGREIGGLVGHQYEKEIRNSYAIGDVISSGEYVGGLVGHTKVPIKNSSATGHVSGNQWIGGLAGKSSHDIIASSASGNVTGEYNYVGGLIGHQHGKQILLSHASGDVTANSTSYSGGLVGLIVNAKINDSHTTSKVMTVTKTTTITSSEPNSSQKNDWNNKWNSDQDTDWNAGKNQTDWVNNDSNWLN